MVHVQCAICDKIESIEDNSLLAKRLINRKAHSYLCNACNERITHKTNERHGTGKFNLYNSKKNNGKN